MEDGKGRLDGVMGSVRSGTVTHDGKRPVHLWVGALSSGVASVCIDEVLDITALSFLLARW